MLHDSIFNFCLKIEGACWCFLLRTHKKQTKTLEENRNWDTKERDVMMNSVKPL